MPGYITSVATGTTCESSYLKPCLTPTCEVTVTQGKSVTIVGLEEMY